MMGDFNEVRNSSERFGSGFQANGPERFNAFIRDADLHDLPLGGYSFTWTNKWNSKMSKLDRFLLSDSLLDIMPNIKGLVLDYKLSDHRPILFKELAYDYGPIPFLLFHSWFVMPDFDHIVKNSWWDDSV